MYYEAPETITEALTLARRQVESLTRALNYVKVTMEQEIQELRKLEKLARVAAGEMPATKDEGFWLEELQSALRDEGDRLLERAYSAWLALDELKTRVVERLGELENDEAA